MVPNQQLDATTVASYANHDSLYASRVPVDRTPEKICSAVARVLKAERARQGLSLNALAEKAGLSRQTVTFVEQEERNPTLDTLLRLTAALGVDLEQIIGLARKQASAKTDPSARK